MSSDERVHMRLVSQKSGPIGFKHSSDQATLVEKQYKDILNIAKNHFNMLENSNCLMAFVIKKKSSFKPLNSKLITDIRRYRYNIFSYIDFPFTSQI